MFIRALKANIMEKVKLFYLYCSDLDDEDGELKDFQKEINKWLAKNPNITIIDRIHTASDNDFVVAIYYQSVKKGLTI